MEKLCVLKRGVLAGICVLKEIQLSREMFALRKTQVLRRLQFQWKMWFLIEKGGGGLVGSKEMRVLKMLWVVRGCATLSQVTS